MPGDVTMRLAAGVQFANAQLDVHVGIAQHAKAKRGVGEQQIWIAEPLQRRRGRGRRRRGLRAHRGRARWRIERLHLKQRIEIDPLGRHVP